MTIRAYRAVPRVPAHAAMITVGFGLCVAVCAALCRGAVRCVALVAGGPFAAVFARAVDWEPRRCGDVVSRAERRRGMPRRLRMADGAVVIEIHRLVVG